MYTIHGESYILHGGAKPLRVYKVPLCFLDNYLETYRKPTMSRAAFHHHTATITLEVNGIRDWEWMGLGVSGIGNGRDRWRMGLGVIGSGSEWDWE